MSISDFTKNLKQQLQESYCASDNKERNRNNKQQQKITNSPHVELITSEMTAFFPQPHCASSSHSSLCKIAGYYISVALSLCLE